MMKSKEDRQERVAIDILLNKYIDGEPHLCRGVNLSLGGMLIHRVFEPDVEPGEVSLEFQLPGSQRIVRVDGITLAEPRDARSHAVRFIRMAAEDEELIERYVRGELDEAAAAF